MNIFNTKISSLALLCTSIIFSINAGAAPCAGKIEGHLCPVDITIKNNTDTQFAFFMQGGNCVKNADKGVYVSPKETKTLRYDVETNCAVSQAKIAISKAQKPSFATVRLNCSNSREEELGRCNWENISSEHISNYIFKFEESSTKPVPTPTIIISHKLGSSSENNKEAH